jgi:hypothetical protein
MAQRGKSARSRAVSLGASRASSFAAPRIACARSSGPASSSRDTACSGSQRIVEGERRHLEDEPIDVAVEQPVRVGRHLDGETGPAAACDHCLAVAQVRRARVRPRLHQADRPGVAHEDVAGRGRAPAHRLLPITLTRGQLDLGEHEVDHAVEQLVLVRDVVIERHGAGAEFATQPTHAERLEPFGIGEPERLAQHAQRVEPLARLGTAPVLSHRASLHLDPPS